MKKVLIVQRTLPHYRIAFFAMLAERLRERGIELALCYGDASQDIQLSSPTLHSWKAPLQTWQIFGTQLTQKISPRQQLIAHDLIIVEQANRLVLNFLLFLLRPWRQFRIAFWGHGYNHQAIESSTLSERIKRGVVHWPDWWFAYTGETRRYLHSLGYPTLRITTVDNTIDIRQLIDHLDAITEVDIAEFRAVHNIRGTHVGVFCGSLYAEKKLDFLLAAALRIRERDQRFELIIAGDGKERPLVEQFAAAHDWVHYVGPRFGREQALLFRLATLQLLPGAVGLAVVDSIVSGTPLITTDCGLHGPEIEYLRNGENGLITAVDIEAYAAAVCDALLDDRKLDYWKRNCQVEVDRFQLDAMADRFAQGIHRCLHESRR